MELTSYRSLIKDGRMGLSENEISFNYTKKGYRSITLNGTLSRYLYENGYKYMDVCTDKEKKVYLVANKEGGFRLLRIGTQEYAKSWNLKICNDKLLKQLLEDLCLNKDVERHVLVIQKAKKEKDREIFKVLYARGENDVCNKIAPLHQECFLGKEVSISYLCSSMRLEKGFSDKISRAHIARFERICKDVEINTVSELLKIKPKLIAMCRNMGEKSVSFIQTVIKEKCGVEWL